MNGIASFITAVSTIFSLYGGGLYANLASVMTPLFTDSRPHVLFVGDLMFDRSIRTAMRANGDDYIFSCIDGTLQKADLVVGNLEGPITESASRSVGSKVGSPDNFVFTFP